ncbi:hypothetical protein [Compostimonas suwonensis]|uniref:Tryptophan synthase subunit alpha n=1 Tax=Compostimonas suwonensis TaxID=1048394 RepID=A0A2M9BU39_9MICO|nr:hypothetical protein [Compostimonas suwonensis]PJJ61465.1 hypothetical protein CLV54_2410 [Compostimonas suwonensis]
MDVPVSIEVLRQEARDELSAVIDYRCRLGDDPWEFMPLLPTVDEHVVATLRSDLMESQSLGEERARAHHPAAPPDVAVEFEYGILRRIALTHPELTRAVWAMVSRLHDDHEHRQA